ncbi:MAG: glycosyltransferase family 1 protein [Dysgonomonas sp.]|nr:glycosyltransferase family 1 protein [Dysgonomonas sp.]
MNIILDCERMKYPNTGLNTFCKQLADAMYNTVREKDKLTFFISSCDNNFLGEDKRYLKQRYLHRKFPICVPNLDIWHTTYQLSRYTGGSLRTKKVLTIHDLNFLYEKTSSFDIQRYTKKHQKIMDRADHIVAISHFVKNDILNHLDTKGKPVSVVYNGYEIDEFPGFDNPTYKPTKPFIFSVGTVNEKKNFHVLSPLLVNNDYELIIAGTISDYAKKIKDYAKKMGVEDRVKVIGAVSSQDKYWYMKNCLAFAFPSIAEGFGLPVLESMHFGKPVFLSNLTSLPEIGGDQAYYFENFDPEYMKDVFEKGMNDYISNNREESIIAHTKKFNWSKCAGEYYDIYQQLTNR